ncbi:glycosyltransferase family 2 protein [Clostridium sp. D2Q-14]|uniref:glycosyltransferase family 2 protein n=1 Tax=Anaeromonas gelatinilytica TaxID=2683194 RepID=UPI00193BFB34|nr:glycosyltransferase family 2 protein [Anaeromonas gelatinilytica]MBS4536222.1 glycosyltransferase family 2 protein [Anaeromonas gelatinilytica]
MDFKKEYNLTVIIPVYNEEDRIISTIKGLKKIDLIDKIIVVDDGSTDNTFKLVNNCNVECIRISDNKGKGYAIKEGLKKIDSKYYIFLDGDLGFTSQEVKYLIKPVINDKYDISIGKFNSINKKNGFGFVKKLAKIGMKFYTGSSINSVLSGQRVYTREALNLIRYIPDRYGIEVAMTIQAVEKKLKIKEVNVNMNHRITKMNIKDLFHRGKQFKDIFFTLFLMYKRR